MHLQGTVAALQTAPIIGDTAANLTDMVARAEEAVRRGANLLVFPELATSGYVFSDREEAATAAREAVQLDAVGRFQRFCAEHGATVVFGYPELVSSGALHNSAAVVDARGLVGNYRKNHLWNLENEIFEPGDLGYPVFETTSGRVGVLICYDLWFPEALRALVLADADVVCLPTNWVPIEGAPHGELAMANLLCQAGSHVNGVTIAAADRVGEERGQPFLGKSVISGHSGALVAGPASGTEPETIWAPYDGAAGRAQRRWNAYNDPVENRRPETYPEH